ncbi:amino acid adenylation domain-containing protein [Chitinophaga dinghuensis]|uniref:Amino acid adenylation domain-containing protein n=1 Tax=Chitinophaga dinghuensis TaxID=1539050 RepID=A0A327VGT1_9BACT|nr:non-ribosomal peptide synthetase [Chitinophaga dinghuensis]RAJ72778.1 amino acid adenylation domain-containing protein [Chitinophaga dinghuensis]
MNIRSLINRLKENNIDVSLSGTDLEIGFDGEYIPEHLLSELKEHKAAIVSFLKDMSTGMEVDIPVAPVAERYPLSSAQRRLWILNRLEEGNIAYNLPDVFIFEGALNIPALEHSFQALIARHEILRTVFAEDEEGNVMQVIHSASASGFQLMQQDLRQVGEQDEMLKALIKENAVQPFDLAAGPLLRAALYHVEDRKWIFAYTIHHIISDGWSMEVLVRELMMLYNAFVAGVPAPLQPLRIQYRDYAVWQQQELSGASYEQHRHYWNTQFEGDLPVLEMPADRLRPAVKTFRGNTVSCRMTPALSKRLKACCQEEGVTLFMGLLTVVDILLYRYTGQSDIIVGSPAAGRDHTDLEGQIGFYINTLALRCRFSGNDHFRKILQQVRTTTLGAYEHQVYPFDELVNQLNLERDLSRNALFDVMVVLQNAKMIAPAGSSQLGELNISVYPSPKEHISQFDMKFDFVEIGDDIQLTLEYNTDIYAAAMMEQLTRHIIQLTDTLLQHKNTPVDTVDYMTEKERKLLLTDFNNTTAAFPEDQTLITLFEEQVRISPDKVALQYKDREYTYEVLNKAANQLGYYLRQQYNIQPDDLIAIQLERSERMIIAMLGVLKAGAAYVPVDPDYPEERTQYIVKDSGSKVLVDEQFMTVFAAGQYPCHTDNLPQINKPDNLAYVIYTSGSTGVPKGCMLEHRGVVNRLAWMWEHYGFRKEEVILQKTTFTFDVSVWEIFLPLCMGASMVLCPREAAGSPEQILSLSAQYQVTCMHFVPSVLNELLSYIAEQPQVARELDRLQRLITSGEALPPETVAKWYRYFHAPLYNLYGPTEASVDVTHYTTAPHDQRIPIGKPVWNTAIRILDVAGNLQPVGIPGEICISGVQVARGYLNQPDLTSAKFTTDPFLHNTGLYKTGDLGRWLPDGNIEYMGRIDQQVKIRGFRIETGEIEAVLEMHPAVKSAVVTVREDNQGEKQLVAYIISAEEIPVAAWRIFLSAKLPYYMLPVHYVRMDRFPLTASGKTDRKKMPAPDANRQQTTVEFIAPSGEMALQLAAIWQDILGIAAISTKDNFFLLGGHSLTVNRLVSRIYKTFKIKIALKDLFLKPVFEQQLHLIKQSAGNTVAGITSAGVRTSYPLSFSQRRLWVLSQFEDASVAYNMPGVYIFRGELQKELLNAAFRILIARHESLSTVFRHNEEGMISQMQLPADALSEPVSFVDLTNREDARERAAQRVRADFSAAFDLAEGPLYCITLQQVEPEEWIFSYVLHHIIADGISLEILMQELIQVYNALLENKEYRLPLLDIQYKDYAVWQQSDYASEADKYFWMKHFEGELPVLELWGDKTRPVSRTYNGAISRKQISKATAAGMIQLISSENSTLFMGMMALVNILLYRYTGQEDIIIGTPVSGREHPDLEHQIGFYANTLAIRTRFSGTDNYHLLLAETRKIVLDTFAHQGYPFDELVEALHIRRDAARNPLFDVQVIVQEGGRQPQAAGGMKGVTISRYGTAEKTTSVFDLVFKFIVFGEDIELSIEYNTDLYSVVFIERLLHHLEQLMLAVTEAPFQPMNRLHFLQQEETGQLLSFSAGPRIQYDEKRTVLDLFYEQADQRPDDIAVSFENTQLTYRQLDELSSQLANYLRTNYDIQPDDFIGIMTDRSDKMIIGILGILKSGAAYVPVDPEYPRSRKEYMLKDTAVKVLITQTDYLFDVDYYTGALFAIDVQLDGLDAGRERPAPQPGPADLAYVIYTSGSTGTPKGVQITHGNLMHSTMPRGHVYKPISAFLLLSSFAFDSSIAGIFGTLCYGGKVCITRKIDVANVEGIAELLVSNQVSHLLTVPSYYALLINALQQRENSLQQVIVAGENCPVQLVQQHFETPGLQHCDFFNEYGPTECAVWSSMCRYDQDYIPSSCIGRPIANTSIFILDAADNLTPVSVAGEICISGHGLARGYLHQEEMTAKKFVPVPFDTARTMYRTGDIGRWNADGTIEFLGRKDDQVKIRGYRIEIGEIENALLTHPDITAAAVVVKTDKSGGKDLVAYIVSDTVLDVPALRDYLGSLLPAYMTPSLFISMELLPLTANGKVDRKNLPDPDGTDMHISTRYVKPRTATEQRLAKIWEELLGREQIGIHDEYFELGGNSLKAMVILKRILDETGVVVSIKTLFLQKNIENTAAYIDTATAQVTAPEMLKENGNGLTHASFSQQIYCSDWKPGNEIVLTPVPLADVELSAFNTAFCQLVERHEILRTAFVMQDGKLYQEVLPFTATGFQIPPLVKVSSEEELQVLIDAEKQRIPDLFAVPLIFVQPYQLPDNSYLMLLRMHHAITDGFSDGIFRRELTALYNAALTGTTAALAPLVYQYSDFATWQHHFVQTEQGMAHQQYWLQKLQTWRPEVMPTISGLKVDSSYSFNKVLFGDQLEDLQQFVLEQRLTCTSLLMGALFLTLYKRNPKEDHTLFMTVSGRNSRYYGAMDVTGLIGNFVNSILVRNIINGDHTLAAYLQSTQEGYLDDLNNDSYPFDKLIHELPQVNPATISDSLVFMNYHNYDYMSRASYEVTAADKTGWMSRKEPIHMPFGLVVSEFQNSLKLQLVFNATRFSEAEAAQIAGSFHQTLSAILSAPDKTVKFFSGREAGIIA